MEYILCRVVESSCLPTQNIVPHISSHDPPYHKTMKKYEDSQSMEAFLFTSLKFAIQTWFCNCPQYLNIFTYFTLSMSASQFFMIKESWFSQIDFFVE